MNCKDIDYMMPLYLSGELDSATTARFESHTAECAPCRREIEELQALDRSLYQLLQNENIDATQLHGRVMNQIQREQPRPPFWRALRITMAAAALVLCAALGFAAYQGNQRYKLAEMDHVNEVVTGHQQLWQTNEADIEALAAKRLSIQLQPQELMIPGYKLLRGRRCLVGTHHYLHLVYGNGAEEMSLYILPKQDLDLFSRVSSLLLSHLHSRAESGYNVTEGDLKGWRILLVGTASDSKQQAIVSDQLNTLS